VKKGWTTYINPTRGYDYAHGVCVFGDYVAVVGEASFRPYVALLRKSDGGVVREWIGREERRFFIRIDREEGAFYSCISIGGKLYAVGRTKVGDEYYGVIYVFDENLNILAKVRSESPSKYYSLAYDGKALYVGGWVEEDINGDGYLEGVGLVEKRALDERLSLVNSKKIFYRWEEERSEEEEIWLEEEEVWWKEGGINIGVEPSTGRIWAVGDYRDSRDKDHSLIVILDSDLRELKVIDYPEGSEGYLGELTGIAFDGKQYAYISSDLGVAKFSVDGELVAINKDVRGRGKIVYYNIVYYNNYLYAFGENVLYIYDANLNIVKKYVLSENVDVPSDFYIGEPALEGNNIYVAVEFYDALDEDDTKIVVYSLSIESVTVATTVAVTATVPTTATAARVGREKAGVMEELVELLISRRVSGLQSGYGCWEGSKPRTVSLPNDVAPEGFGGVWSCCLLGCGGWGCAYRCERSGEIVVFKVPRGFESIIEDGRVSTVPEKLLKRVVEEASTIMALRHPNILRLHAASRKAPILAYEYADYGSVEWQIARGWKPSLKDVLLVAIQVGDALRYIHSRGLLHGDIKAGNIFIAGGVAKLGDFSSLTKLLATTSSHSRLVYTPGWRAPEQVYSDLRGRAKERGLEQRIDVYQLGNLILYMLTGETLDGEDALEEGRVADAVKSVEHGALREVLREALQPKPWNRPSSEELVKRLLEVYKSL